MDLLATAVMPAGLAVTYYLIFIAIFNIYYENSSIDAYILLILVLVVMILPAFLVLLTSLRYNYFGWMLIYLLSLPIWQVVLPIYSFWNMDDFSWGETRKVSGEESVEDHSNDENGQLATQIPFKRWDEYEKEWRSSIIPRNYNVK